jgi:hypothetical protein
MSPGFVPRLVEVGVNQIHKLVLVFVVEMRGHGRLSEVQKEVFHLLLDRIVRPAIHFPLVDLCEGVLEYLSEGPYQCFDDPFDSILPFSLYRDDFCHPL